MRSVCFALGEELAVAKREWQRRRREIPSGDPCDPGFRRLKYVRYADDFLLGFIGSKQEAIEIRDRLALFLQQKLGLELSAAKTLITHGSEHARFLGYEVTVIGWIIAGMLLAYLATLH